MLLLQIRAWTIRPTWSSLISQRPQIRAVHQHTLQVFKSRRLSAWIICSRANPLQLGKLYLLLLQQMFGLLATWCRLLQGLPHSPSKQVSWWLWHLRSLYLYQFNLAMLSRLAKAMKPRWQKCFMDAHRSISYKTPIILDFQGSELLRTPTRLWIFMLLQYQRLVLMVALQPPQATHLLQIVHH